NGIRHWRAYSLTSDPDHPEGFVSITVKHVEAGRMSPYFTRRVEPGSMVFLGDVEGEFRLPDELPQRSLFISAGSGVTPIWCMLRDLERRDALGDVVHLHSSRTAEQVIFGEYLQRMDSAYGGYRFIAHLTGEPKRIVPDDPHNLRPDSHEHKTIHTRPRARNNRLPRHR